MEFEAVYALIFFVLFIFLSGFFSGSESAYFSFKSNDIYRLKEKKKKSKNLLRVLKLLRTPRRLLMTILIGNTIVNVAAATLAALFTSKYIPEHYLGRTNKLLIEIILVTIIILIFSEVTPKVFAVKNYEKFALAVSLPLMGVVKVFTPISYLFDKLYKMFAVVFKVKKDDLFITKDDMKTVIQVSEEKGTIDNEEKEMINSIFKFSDTAVKEVMVPRMDMVVLEKNATYDEVIKLVRSKGHSRIPVYDEDVDKIIGILFVKNLLEYKNKNKKFDNLADLVKKPYYVPETKKIDELLREFQQERIHLAIVVDEYGGTAGLVTLEDVIEEIVGEIQDEYDNEKSLISKVDGNSWIVDGKIGIEELNERIALDLPTEDEYESLGGFILNKLRRIPEHNEEIVYRNYKFSIESLFENRIKKVRIMQMRKENEKDN
ncbi:MAG: hemolysin family protein [bacterium]